MEKRRFKTIYRQHGREITRPTHNINLRESQILCDTETGVNYLIVMTINGACMTILVDKDGKPIVTEKQQQA